MTLLPALISNGLAAQQYAESRSLRWAHLRYDTRSEADEVLGIALGCRGVVDLALLPLCSANAQAILPFLKVAWSATSTARLLIENLQNQSRRLAFRVSGREDFGGRQLQAESLGSLSPLGDFCDFLKTFHKCELPKRELIVLWGAGPDVYPLIEMALAWGREVVVFDHRLDARESLRHCESFKKASCFQVFEPSMENFVPFLPFVRNVIVMTHNLHQDAQAIDIVARASQESIDNNRSRFLLSLLGPSRRANRVFEFTEFASRQMCEENPSIVFRSPAGLEGMKTYGSGDIAISLLADCLSFEKGESCGSTGA